MARFAGPGEYRKSVLLVGSPRFVFYCRTVFFRQCDARGAIASLAYLDGVFRQRVHLCFVEVSRFVRWIYTGEKKYFRTKVVAKASNEALVEVK